MKNIEEVLLDFENKVSWRMESYSQFTIDFIDNAIIDLPEEEDELVNSVGAYKYRIQNVINIMKDGLDKDLFIDLLKSIEDL